MSDEKLSTINAKLDSLLMLAADVSVPLVVAQAMDDNDLPPAAQTIMWHLRKRLNPRDFVDVYADSLRVNTGKRKQTIGQMLTVLVRAGYLEERPNSRPRAFRLPYTRCIQRKRAA